MTLSVLANRRHRGAARDVTRGTAARVQDMAVDIGLARTKVVVVACGESFRKS